jgi:dihydrofolate reductase
MRKLVFGINVTADGYCDHHLGIPDDEMVEYFTRLMRESDTLLYGRKTYELMFPYWPEIARTNSGTTKADNEFARAMAAVPRVVVVSKTLPHPEAENVMVIRANLESEILRLKKEPGKSISTGGVTLPSRLLDLGLIDEFHLVIHPTMAGKGRRLFDGANLKDRINLKLVDSHVFKSGIVAHHYLKQ